MQDSKSENGSNVPSFKIEDMIKARESKFSVFNSRCIDGLSRSTSPVVNYLDEKQKNMSNL